MFRALQTQADQIDTLKHSLAMLVSVIGSRANPETPTLTPETELGILQGIENALEVMG
jgi:hypothetical protein